MGAVRAPLTSSAFVSPGGRSAAGGYGYLAPERAPSC
jgi:hypothetical protein